MSPGFSVGYDRRLAIHSLMLGFIERKDGDMLACEEREKQKNFEDERHASSSTHVQGIAPKMSDAANAVQWGRTE
jgi:hypothetical protein